jgi:alanine racemase
MDKELTGPRASISTDALRHNLGVVKRTAPDSKVLAVIKANAYGHGMVQVALALKEADALGVARIQEALTLRQAKSINRILLLEGIFSKTELEVAAREDFWLVVHNFAQLEMLESWSGGHRFAVWLKVDTGMHRLGFNAEQFPIAWRRANACNGIGSIRVMTHLASSEDPLGEATTRQLLVFDELMSGLSVERSIANSAAVLGLSRSRTDWVRPGLMLYGISPFDDREAHQIGLQPAMTLETMLIATHQLAAGERVGYGGTWTSERPSRVGIVAIGYGDGYPRHTRSGAPVRVNGQNVSLAGRVSMDMIAVDLTTAPNADVGANVQLWGDDLPVERIARYADTIPYELVCGISQRVQVKYR